MLPPRRAAHLSAPRQLTTPVRELPYSVYGGHRPERLCYSSDNFVRPTSKTEEGRCTANHKATKYATMSECGGSVRVKVDTLDVANYSGDFAPYSDFYTALSYINQDPQPSVDVEQLYMGATARGCGAWFVAVTPPSQRWNVGHTYYTADGAGW